MAVPVIENTPTYQVNVGTSITLTKPTGLANEDILLVHMITDDGSENHGHPGDWTVIYEDTSDASLVCTASAWYKVITDASSEPANYTFTVGTSERIGAIIFRISGVDNDEPVDNAGAAKSSNFHATNAPATGTGITTVTDECLIFGFCGKDPGSSSTPTLATGGWTAEDEGLDGELTGVGFAAASKSQATAGSTGDVEWTISAGHDWIAYQVALKPAAEVPTHSLDDPVGVGDSADAHRFNFLTHSLEDPV